MSNEAIPSDQVQQIAQLISEGQELHVHLSVPVHLIIEKRQTDLEGNQEVQVTLKYNGWYLTDPITATKPVESLAVALMHFGIRRRSNYNVQPKTTLAALEYSEEQEE